MNTFKRKALFTLFAIAAAMLSGCESFGAPRMTPEQLKESVKDKNASAACATYGAALVADGAVMYVNIDDKVVKNGKLEVHCGANSVIYSNTQAAPQ